MAAEVFMRVENHVHKKSDIVKNKWFFVFIIRNNACFAFFYMPFAHF